MAYKPAAKKEEAPATRSYINQYSFTADRERGRKTGQNGLTLDVKFKADRELVEYLELGLYGDVERGIPANPDFVQEYFSQHVMFEYVPAGGVNDGSTSHYMPDLPRVQTPAQAQR